MAGNDAIHSPTGLPHGVVKFLGIGTQDRVPGFALKDAKHVTLENQPLSGKVDGQLTIGVGIGDMQQLHRPGSVGDGPAILDRFNLRLLLGLAEAVRFQGVG